MMNAHEYFEISNTDLYKYNSMRLHANAERFYLPFTVDGLIEICKKFASAESFTLLGKGSNTIFVSENYSRPIVCTNLLDKIEFQDGKIVAECGVTLSQLAWFALEKSVGGYEFLEDIPGSVGGALFMNAGTYSDTISQLVESVTVFDFEKSAVLTLTEDDLKAYWGKRTSYFCKNNCCILECEMKADAVGDYLQILEKMLEIKKSRYLKQPRDYPNAGSVFKRPYKNGEPFYVWKLLEETGLRGYSIGGACISQKHPGFILNSGNCTGTDIQALLDVCKNRVKEKFDIRLEEEWKIVKEDRYD